MPLHTAHIRGLGRGQAQSIVRGLYLSCEVGVHGKVIKQSERKNKVIRQEELVCITLIHISQKHILMKKICPEAGPMKNRPDIGLHPGTMLIEINHNGFLGILSQKWVQNT